jgi:hypothetical protein
MTIQQQLAALLSGATAAGPRVYPLTAPDGVIKPYITYQRISVNSENVLSGASGLTNTRIEIDIYAATYGEACAIASQVDALLAAWSAQNVSVLSQDFYEDPVKLFRVSSDYSIWH